MTQELLTLEELIGANGMMMNRTTLKIEDIVQNGIKRIIGATKVTPLNVSQGKTKNKIERGYKGTFPYTIELVPGICTNKILEIVDVRDTLLRKREGNPQKIVSRQLAYKNSWCSLVLCSR